MADNGESFEAATYTEKVIGDLPDGVVGATCGIVDHLQERDGITWSEGGGSGGFLGLEEVVEDAITAKMPKCDAAARCRLRVAIGDVGIGRVIEGSNLELTCGPVEYDTQEGALADKERCDSHHGTVVTTYAQWSQRTHASITADKALIAAAQKRIAQAL
jgi:hypothetical protein